MSNHYYALYISDDMLTRMKDRNLRDLVYLINKPPRWNEQVSPTAALAAS